MAGDRLLPESLACAGPGTVECCKSAVVFATFEALSLSQPSSTSPPTALVPGVGPATLPGNASLGDLPISGCLSSRLWDHSPAHHGQRPRLPPDVHDGWRRLPTYQGQTEEFYAWISYR